METLLFIMLFCFIVAMIGLIGVYKTKSYDSIWGGLLFGGSGAFTASMLAAILRGILIGLGLA